MLGHSAISEFSISGDGALEITTKTSAGSLAISCDLSGVADEWESLTDDTSSWTDY